MSLRLKLNHYIQIQHDHECCIGEDYYQRHYYDHLNRSCICLWFLVLFRLCVSLGLYMVIFRKHQMEHISITLDVLCTDIFYSTQKVCFKSSYPLVWSECLQGSLCIYTPFYKSDIRTKWTSLQQNKNIFFFIKNKHNIYYLGL